MYKNIQIFLLLLFIQPSYSEEVDDKQFSLDQLYKLSDSDLENQFLQSAKAGGYPKIDIQKGSITFLDDSWTENSIVEWRKYSNHMRLYISTLVIPNNYKNISKQERNKRILGFYHCMNASSVQLGFLQDSLESIKVEDTVADATKICLASSLF